jgi:hypothetical protein
VIEVGEFGGGRAKAPAQLERRLSFSRRKAGKELQQQIDSKHGQAAEKREALLQVRIDKARASATGSSTDGSARNSGVDSARNSGAET